MRIRSALARDEGGILVTFAVILPVLILLAGGGIVAFTTSAGHRELQRAADQGALAGAAALPPIDPKVLVDPALDRLPDTSPVFDLLPPKVDTLVGAVDDTVGQHVPLIGELIPDPRDVACAVASKGNLDPASAAFVGAFEDSTGLDTPIDPDADTGSKVCADDQRVSAAILTDPTATTAIECTNRLVQQVSADVGEIDPSVDKVLDPAVVRIQALVNQVVNLPLNHALPAAFTPMMRVDATTYMRPPMYGLVFPSADGITLRATATAYRRIKNAVVVPILPEQELPIKLGLLKPYQAMLANLNLALHTSQTKLLAAIDRADTKLDTVMSRYGLPCEHLLHNLRQDIRDIYNPPTGPAPEAIDIVESAIQAAKRTARDTGIPEPDPTNPESLAGEAFVLVGVSVTNLMEPIADTQIPILDVALAVMDKAGDGSYKAAIVSAANAYGAFRSTLVE